MFCKTDNESPNGTADLSTGFPQGRHGCWSPFFGNPVEQGSLKTAADIFITICKHRYKQLLVERRC
jgi:hypothetical protein